MNKTNTTRLLTLNILSLLICGCSSLPSHPTYAQTVQQSESMVDANYSINKQYYICVAESCHKTTPLRKITYQDMQPLQPDVSPIIIVNKESPQQVKQLKIKKKRKLIKHKPRKINNEYTRKCFLIKSGESVNIVNSNSLLDKVSNSIESKNTIVNKNESSIINKPKSITTKQVNSANVVKGVSAANAANAVTNLFGN